ncbi:hypothetical protein BGZ79_008264, partial [Entomortierella chlamydospora]
KEIQTLLDEFIETMGSSRDLWQLKMFYRREQLRALENRKENSERVRDIVSEVSRRLDWTAESQCDVLFSTTTTLRAGKLAFYFNLNSSTAKPKSADKISLSSKPKVQILASQCYGFKSEKSSA